MCPSLAGHRAVGHRAVAAEARKRLYSLPRYSLLESFLPGIPLTGLMVSGLLLLLSGLSGCADAQQRSSFELLAHKRQIIDEHAQELTSLQKGVISHHPGRTFEAIDATLEKFLEENDLRARAEQAKYQPGAVRLFKGGPYEGGIPPELTP